MARRLRQRSRVEQRIEPAIVAGRVPPHDLDAEAACIDRCIGSKDGRAEVLDLLEPKHMYSDANRVLLEAIIELDSAGSDVSATAIAGLLRDRERLAQVGGTAYIGRIMNETPYVLKIREVAERVRDLWQTRQMIAACQRIAAEGYGDVGDRRRWLDASESAIYEVAHQERPSDVMLLRDAAQEVFTRLNEAAERGERLGGVATGYDRLDSKLGGLRAGNVVVIAARPGMGKTALGTNIAMNVASPRDVRGVLVSGDGVLVCSLEMPREQLAERIMCAEARVDLRKMRNAFLQPDDWRRLTDAAAFISHLPIVVDDTPAISVMVLRAKARRANARLEKRDPPMRIGLIVVDYMQLMSGRGDEGSREEEIASVSRDLKTLAKELTVPIIALAQLNRAVETRSAKDKRPMLSDLRESGAIEQDADTIIFIYRDEYYHPETTNAKGIAELIVAKHRHGPTGKVHVRFAASCTRFDNLAAGDYAASEDE